MSIIFAELYGQKNYEKLRKESFLSLSAGGGFTIVLSIISLLVLYPVLGLIQTPLATVIAQLFSAGVCLWIMRKKHPIFFFSRKDMGMDQRCAVSDHSLSKCTKKRVI